MPKRVAAETWADDDTIVFSPSQNARTVLLRVPAAGGKPTHVRCAQPGRDRPQRRPQALPGGKAVLYTESPSVSIFDDANIVAVAVPVDASAKAGPAKVVVPSAYYRVPAARSGRTRPSALHPAGHALRGALRSRSASRRWARRVPAIEGLTSSASVGRRVRWTCPAEGTLVVRARRGDDRRQQRPSTGSTRDGKTSVAAGDADASWANPRFSPDGQKMALDISDGKQRDIWVYDWARDTLTQLTFDPGSDTASRLDARRQARRVHVRSAPSPAARATCIG